MFHTAHQGVSLIVVQQSGLSLSSFLLGILMDLPEIICDEILKGH